MSITVELSELADTMAQFSFAYLLTVTDDGRSHASAVQQPQLVDNRIVVRGVGKRSGRNAGVRPGITLLWPPADVDGYSLIVDGEAEFTGDSLSVMPTRAVLHRPVASPEPDSACGADCVELPTATND